MKNNLAIISLSNNYSRQIGKQLADFLELFYVDLDDILEYNLVNSKMLEIAGKEYFDAEKQKVIKSVAQFDNSLVVGNLELFLTNNNFNYFKNDFYIIYLFCDKEKIEDIEKKFEVKRQFFAFDEEDKICKSYANLVINVDNANENNFEFIKNAILNHLGDCDEY